MRGVLSPVPAANAAAAAAAPTAGPSVVDIGPLDDDASPRKWHIKAIARGVPEAAAESDAEALAGEGEGGDDAAPKAKRSRRGSGRARKARGAASS